MIVEEGPEQMGHGKGDMLPITVGKNVLLSGNPLLSSFKSAGAAGF